MQSQGGSGRGQPPAVVTTVEVTRETWIPALSAVGSAVPTSGIMVAAEVPGKVSEIFFITGDRVEQGARIVQLDDEVDRAELDILLADRKLAAITLERTRKLVADKLASASELDEAEARLESLEAQVAAKRAIIRKKDVRAPFAGELGIRRVSPGRYVAAGEEIVSLVSLSPIFIEFTLPERHLGRLARDQQVEVEVPAHPERTFSGRIHAITPGIEEGTRSVRVRGIFANDDRALRPGMFAEVRILEERRREVLTLPYRAVTYDPYGSSVFLVEETEGGLIATRRQVDTGEVRDGMVEILSGLALGDRVVGAGQNKLRTGQPVTVDNSVELEERRPGGA
ncbi:efflux RND transporter periplasmic adaptor subunit [Lentisalinibacter salinarum]|uniref:efflux RND transporter periplasmic adaptor subunit n=1 Tax=Lentisalinibacter salinarum TaxID=2992239 RepID=UPI00386C9807